MFLEILFFSRAHKLDKNHMKSKDFYTYHIYILGHLRIWLVFTRFLCLLLLQKIFKLASIFLNTSFGRKTILYIDLLSQEYTLFATAIPDPFWAAQFSFGISIMSLLTWFLIEFMYMEPYKVQSTLNFLFTWSQSLCAPFF